MLLQFSYHVKRKLTSISFTFILLLEYGPPGTLETSNFCILMANFLWIYETSVAFPHKFQLTDTLTLLTPM